MSFLNAALILTNTIILVSGQFLWKFGLQHTPPSFASVGSIIKMFFNPFIFSGLVMYGLATILWLYILTRVPLSIAYPLQSIAYVLAVFGAFFVFDEPLTTFKIIGVLLIVAGVSLIGVAGNQI
ncbi:EamA family transporter [Virgibacillus sp. JSM 102003]|uniref:EamA family transporter n=1 Tax=Virgibacillus sp. JSM 102003 TaxID=1562108 RepID=UPI0035C08BB5